MAPTAVLDQFTTARTTINTTSFSNQTTSARSNDSYGFRNYQLTTVGASEAIIHTLVSVPISAPPYRNALIAKIFFRQILGHTASPSIPISDLVSTVATYFNMSTEMAEIDAKIAADSIRDSIFRVDNMTGVGYLNSKEKSVTIDDHSSRPPNVAYITFRSTINPHIVDPRAHDAIHLFEFSLRLPNIFLSSSVILPVDPLALTPTIPTPAVPFDDTLSQISDAQFENMTETQTRQLLSARRDAFPA